MKFIWYSLLVGSLFSCEIQYGMLDNSINASTFSVELFEDQAANAPAGYGIAFTEYLRDFLVARSKMKLTNEKADIELSGKIKRYYTAPVSIQNDETAAQNSLKVVLKVAAIHNLDEKQSFESEFVQFSNYPSSSDLSSVEDELLEDINEKLAQDILNYLSRNW